MADNTTFLITGANRGLGKALVSHYLSQPSHTVIAAVRDPSSTSSLALQDLPKGANSSLLTVQIRSESATDASDAVFRLESGHGIRKLDTVVANAGISRVFPPVHELQVADLQAHMDVNVMGVVRLFQAVRSLLGKAERPKFVTMGSSAASMGLMGERNFPNSAYGTSKAALNYVTLKIHYENPGLVAFPLDPGWVQTDLGNDGAVALGFEKAEISVEESLKGMVQVIDSATRESASGKFMVYDGTVAAW